MARVSKELQELKAVIDEELKIDEENIENLELDTNLILTLKESASYMSDERLPEYTYHSIESILLIVIFGIMAKCNTFVEIYLFMQKHTVWLNRRITLLFLEIIRKKRRVFYV